MKPYSRQLLTAVFSFTIVASTAVFALVLEDWLPASHDPPVLNTTWQRLGIALGLALLLLCLAFHIAKDRKNHGTLYYYRILDERAPDLHEQARERAMREYLDCRTVTRSLSLGGGAWVDIADIVEQSRLDLERAVDSDDPGTSHEFAPNAHWPIEFAIGYEWPLPESTRIVEFNTTDPKGVTAGAAISKPGGVEPVPESERDGQVELVWVDIHLTKEKPAQDGDRSRKESSRQIFDRYPDRTVLWGWPDEDNSGCYSDSVDLRPAVDLGSEELLAAAELVARAILRALNAYPNATIAVGARTPKTVAVLSGRYFAAYLQLRPSTPATDDARAQYQSWSDPWRRLILLSYNQPIRQWQALKIRRNQTGMQYRHFQPSSSDAAISPTAFEELINLTPHDVHLVDSDLVIPRQGSIARVKDVPAITQRISYRTTTVPIVDILPGGEIEHLPDPATGKAYIVSRVTASGLSARDDVVFPFEEVRDGDGRIIGCRALGRFRATGNDS